MAKKKLTEAERLRLESEHLLREQREVLAHAGSVVRDASRELGRYAATEAYPRVAAGARRAADSSRHKIVDEVLPGIAGVIGSTLSAVDAARGLTRKTAAPLLPAPARKSGAGKYVALGFGLAILVGVGYVLWENFRADDELWIED
jgi:hypothetical protein